MYAYTLKRKRSPEMYKYFSALRGHFSDTAAVFYYTNKSRKMGHPPLITSRVHSGKKKYKFSFWDKYEMLPDLFGQIFG